MLNMNGMKSSLVNKKSIIVKRNYRDGLRNFVIYAYINLYKNKIILEIEDFDVTLLHEYCSEDLPCKRKDIKKFNTLEEALAYLFKTTILREDDFQNKFKMRKEDMDKKQKVNKQ